MANRLRGDSTSPNKSDSQTCQTCNEPICDDALECMWCERLQHRSCIKISDNHYSALSSFPSNIVFFCMSSLSCFHKLPSAIKAHDNLQEMYSHAH